MGELARVAPLETKSRKFRVLGKRGPHPGAGQKRGGRKAGTPNRSTQEIKALAQEHGPNAIKKLAELMAHSESDETQSRAAQALLDRGYGKPAAQHNLAGHEGGPLGAEFFRNLSPEELEVWIMRLSAVAEKSYTPKDGSDGG
jgi:hypothetical protein